MHFIAGMEDNFTRIEYDRARAFDQLPQPRLAEIGQERDVRFQEGNVGCIHDRRQRDVSQGRATIGPWSYRIREPKTSDGSKAEFRSDQRAVRDHVVLESAT